MGFGNVLKNLREKAGLSQSALAQRLGLSVRSIQNWEQGHRVPRSRVLLALARGVGVPVERLLAEITAEDQGEPAAAAPEPEPPPAPPRPKRTRRPKGGDR
jgi:transcriptional regulator with XRE-family HTH domain